MTDVSELVEWCRDRQTSNMSPNYGRCADKLEELAAENERLEKERAEQWRLRREAISQRDLEKALLKTVENERDEAKAKVGKTEREKALWRDQAYRQRDKAEAAERQAGARVKVNRKAVAEAIAKSFFDSTPGLSSTLTDDYREWLTEADAAIKVILSALSAEAATDNAGGGDALG